jgi:hypothetical protein
LRMKAICPFEMGATTHPTTQRHIPEDQKPHLHLWENSSVSITRYGRSCKALAEWLPTVTTTHYLYCSCTQTHLQFFPHTHWWTISFLSPHKHPVAHSNVLTPIPQIIYFNVR